jgi:hypothetical protein
VINFSIQNYENTIALSFDTDLSNERLGKRSTGVYNATIKIPPYTLKPGFFFFTFNTGIANIGIANRYEKCLKISIELNGENESFISYAEKRPGLFPLRLNWETIKINDEKYSK